MKERVDLRLYFDPVYSEMAKAIGYGGISLPKAKKRIDELAERVSREKVVVVIEEIARIERLKCRSDDGAAYLTDKAESSVGSCWVRHRSIPCTSPLIQSRRHRR